MVTVTYDQGFAWGDAAVGAGITLALGALVAAVGLRRRRIASPAI